MYVYNLVTNIDKDKVIFDFLVQGRNGVALEKSLRENYKTDCKFYQVPAFKDNLLASMKYLKRLYRSKHYDYVYVNASLSTDLYYVLPFIIRFGKSRVIVHSHNSSLYGKEKQHYCFQWLPKLCAGVKLTCSDKAAEWMFGSSEGVRIIHNGIDTEKFRFSEAYRAEIRQKYDIDDDTLVIGHVGRLMYQKNQEFLIRIMADMKKRGIRARLLLVGEGEDRNKLEKLVKDNNLTEYVIFCGQQKETEKYYSAFDVFAMPSHYEGLPIVGIEAQASGLPCIFSDKIDRQVLLIDQADMIDLNSGAEYWRILIEDAPKVSAINREAYAEVIGNMEFGIKGVAEEIEDLLMKQYKSPSGAWET